MSRKVVTIGYADTLEQANLIRDELASESDGMEFEVAPMRSRWRITSALPLGFEDCQLAYERGFAAGYYRAVKKLLAPSPRPLTEPTHYHAPSHAHPPTCPGCTSDESRHGKPVEVRP